MKMIEKQIATIEKEIEKLNARYERVMNKKAKTVAKAEKLGCADWTYEEYQNKREILGERARAKHEVFIEFDTEIMTEKQAEVLWELFIAIPNEIEEIERNLKNAHKRLEKRVEEFAGIREELENIESAEAKEESWISGIQIRNSHEDEYEKWLAEFKRDCLRDGVVIETVNGDVISGFTKSGKVFVIYGNSFGFTFRYLNCYTLRIDGEVIFTSGTFSTAYRVIRK